MIDTAPAFDRLLDGLFAERDAGVGAVVRVSRGSGAVSTWSAGRARADSEASMSADTGFHIASVGKAMTAVLLLQLWEAGALGPQGLDAPIAGFDVLGDVLAHLPVLTDAPVTLRQMLTHTSGLRDAFNDDGELTAAENGGRPAPRSLGAHLRASAQPDPGTGRRWPPWAPAGVGDAEAGVLNWFIRGSGAATRSVHPPGARFHYSDTAYMLLALLTERLTGLSYEAQLNACIFAPLAMDGTFLAYGEGAPKGWRGRVSDFIYGGKPVFSAGLDASWDWGGGGQVSTARDLDVFLRALGSGALFGRPETRDAMLRFDAPPGLPEGCTGLGLGVRRLVSPGGVELRGHAGAWSVQAFYAPAFDATITGTFNQPMAAHPRFRTWVLEVADTLAEPTA